MRLSIVLNPVLLNSLWKLHISKLSHAAAVYLIGLVHMKWERLWWANLAKLIVRLIVSDWILCCILPAPRANEASRNFNNLIETVKNFFLLLPNCVPDQIHQTFTCVESRWPKTLGSNFAQFRPIGRWGWEWDCHLQPGADDEAQMTWSHYNGH